MDSYEKLAVAQKLIQADYSELIISLQRDPNRPALKIMFSNGNLIYIRYNDYFQYSYQIIYSQSPFDRIRFDNFDDHWNVDTKPHHKHERGSRKVSKSPMVGDPQKDIVKLNEFIAI